MDESFDLSDMSWLTQIAKPSVPTFKIVDSEDEELLVVDDKIKENHVGMNEIDLEDGKVVSGNQLYGDVFAEERSN